MFSDDDLLPISGLQHLTFCERQWVLIHMECEWDENELTVEGKQLHEFVHEQGSGSRSGVLMVCGLRLRSLEYGLTGVADLVEFHKSEDGAVVEGHSGRWMPYPVEYKRGRKRYDHADEMQLCAQIACLEEMFSLDIPSGAIFYGQPRRRYEMDASDSMMNELKEACARARDLYDHKSKPRPNIGKHCQNCSLVIQCMPDVISNDRSLRYVEGIFRDLSLQSQQETDT
jgi:CRISPR-associated exonuclease Cas4